MLVEPWQIPVIVMATLALPVWLYYWAQSHFNPQRGIAKDGAPRNGATGDSLREGIGGSRHDKFSTPKSPARAWARTAAFALLTLLLVVIFGWALGPSV